MQELATMWPVGSPAVRVLVMVPTYNEAENIDEVLRRVRRRAARRRHPRDRRRRAPTAPPSSRRSSATSSATSTCCGARAKSGLGSAYRAGFRKGLADGYDVMVEMDADLSHDPDALPTLIERVEQGADLAIGSRYVRGGSIPDWKLGRRTISRVGCLYAADHARAVGERRHRRVPGLPPPALSQIDLDARARRRLRLPGGDDLPQPSGPAARIVEVPIEFRDRTLGRSKMSSRIVVEAFLLVTRWGIRDRIARVRRSYEDLRARH